MTLSQSGSNSPIMEAAEIKQIFQTIVRNVSEIVMGKENQVRLALTCIFAGGHLLIEDIPGIGKTTLAKVLAGCLGLEFQRVQFTSDLLPGDILGTSIFEQATGTFRFHQGPVFTQVLLADEINRATPKTQSALLEAMEEHQVTIENTTYMLESPFFVMATQNPFEYSGTFPLPESQLDRFLMRISLGYPEREAEARILKGKNTKVLIEDMSACVTRKDVIEIQDRITRIHTSDAFIAYLQNILEFTRTSSHFYIGLSPRAGLSLLQAARSRACLDGREFAIPEDLQFVMPHVVGHRLKTKDDMSQFKPADLNRLLMEIPIP